MQFFAKYERWQRVEILYFYLSTTIFIGNKLQCRRNGHSRRRGTMCRNPKHKEIKLISKCEHRIASNDTPDESIVYNLNFDEPPFAMRTSS